MKILLTFIGNFCLNQNSRLKQYTPPLGISVLSSFLKKHGYQTQLIDLRLLPNVGEFNQYIKKFRPDVIGFSLLTSEVELGISVINFVSKNHPSIKIIIGGPHATVCPNESAQIPGVLAVIVGEGELILLNLLKAIKSRRSLATVRGIYFQKHQQIISTPPERFIHDLD